MTTIFVAATEGSLPKLKAVADCITDGWVGAMPWPDGALALYVPNEDEEKVAKELLIENGLTILDRGTY